MLKCVPQVFYIKQNDTLPILETQILGSDGKPITLLPTSTVTFRMRKAGGIVNGISESAFVLDPSTAKLQFQFAAAQTSVQGSFYAEWVIENGTDIQSVPTQDYQVIHVLPDLDIIPLTP